MKKELRIFLIKLIGTFIVLAVIVAIGKKLKSFEFEENYSSIQDHRDLQFFDPDIRYEPNPRNILS